MYILFSNEEEEDGGRPRRELWHLFALAANVEFCDGNETTRNCVLSPNTFGIKSTIVQFT